MPASDLVALIAKTGFAVSMEETRYNLNGIYMHEKTGEESHLTAVATDGHRLACSGIRLPEGAQGIPGIIIPRKTINELSGGHFPLKEKESALWRTFFFILVLNLL